jgi:hypothetical protein
MRFAETVFSYTIWPSEAVLCVLVFVTHLPEVTGRNCIMDLFVGSLELGLIEFVIKFVSQNNNNEVASVRGIVPLTW